MQYYKIPNDPFPHFLSEEDILNDGESYLPKGFKKITEAQANKMRALAVPKPTEEDIRSRRDYLLTQCDWVDTLSAKARLGEEVFDSWMKYRQDLRDVTAQVGFPSTVVWPVKPD